MSKPQSTFPTKTCHGTPGLSKPVCLNTTFDNTSSTKEYLEFHQDSQKSPKGAALQGSSSGRRFDGLAEVHLDGHTLQGPSASSKSTRCSQLKIGRKSLHHEAMSKKGVSPLVSCFTPRRTADSDCEKLKAVDNLFKFGVSQGTPRHQAPSRNLVEDILEDAASTTRIIRVPNNFDSDYSSDSSYSPEPDQKKLKVGLHCSSAATSKRGRSRLGRLISQGELNSKYMTRSKSKKIFKETGQMPPMLELASSSDESCKGRRYNLRSKAPSASRRPRRPLYELKQGTPVINSEVAPRRRGTSVRFGFDEDSSSLQIPSEELCTTIIRKRKDTPKRKAKDENSTLAQARTGETSCQQPKLPFMNLEAPMAEFTVVEEPCSLLAQFQKTLDNPETITETLKEEEVSIQPVAAPILELRSPEKSSQKQSQPRKFLRPRAKSFRLKVPKEAERHNGKDRYRSKRFLNRLRQLWEKDRSYKKFHLYDEDRIFRDEMKNLEGMFRESQDDTQVKEQDEDVDTDEDVLDNNRRFVLNELSQGIEAYLCTNESTKERLSKRQDLVRNYLNPDLCGFDDWN